MVGDFQPRAVTAPRDLLIRSRQAHLCGGYLPILSIASIFFPSCPVMSFVVKLPPPRTRSYTKEITLTQQTLQQSLNFSRLASQFLASIAIAIAACSTTAFSQSRPDPATIESTWRKSVSKYDGARQQILKRVDEQTNSGPFHPYWESLQKYQVPAWYEDAKFGIFIHWGLYSVPAFANEWYSRNMYQKGSKEFQHHIATYGPQNKFGYKDFIPMFTAAHFDPQAWARLFREAGAKYVVPVAEHHDGFPNYDSNLTDWCASKMGPKRDLIGELAKAVRAEGLHFGTSSHRAEHDWFFDGGRQFDSDVSDPRYADFYGPAHFRLLKPGYDDKLFEDWTFVSGDFMDDWLVRTAEIVEKYHPDLIYFDWWIGQPAFRDHVARFAAFYYNQGAKLGSGAIINYKNNALEEHSATLDVERGQLTDIRPMHWQTDTSVSNASWGYVEGDTFKSPEFIVHLLVDVVSKNGNLLLNIPPRPDGTIPDPVQQLLREIGGWLKVNGEAIYGTRPWTRYGEGPTMVAGGAFHDTETKPYTPEDFRFTTHDGSLYAIELGWPRNGTVVIHSLGSESLKDQKIESVALLGSEAKLEWKQTVDGLRVQVPGTAPGKYAYAFRIRGTKGF
jgi:alpha-L-fucosidase